MRILLASCPFGRVESLSWPCKSPTKQSVAMQPTPEPQPTLFDGVGCEEEIAGLLELQTTKLEVRTFVVAHTLDPVTGGRELFLGRPRFNRDKGAAWHWYEKLLGGPTTPGGRLELPQPVGPDMEPDAPVRLRKKQDQRDSANGQR